MLQSGDVVALTGDLGSGKTTLTQAMAAGLGVTDLVTSPTFNLIHEYGGPTRLYHFDPYRLDRPEEIAILGLDDYLERDGVVVVEWADLIVPLLPPDRFIIQLEIDNSADRGAAPFADLPRVLTITGYGARPAAVVDQLSQQLVDSAPLPGAVG